MRALHDIVCTLCGRREENVIVDVDNMPGCETCGGPTETNYEKWDDTPMIGTLKAHLQELWRDIDPGNTKERMKGTAMVTVPEEIGNA